MSKRTKEAPAWDYFDVNETQERFATCKICKKDVSRGSVGKAKKDFSTKGMNEHLKLHHPSQWKEVLKAREGISAKKTQLSKEAEQRREVYRLADTTDNTASTSASTSVQQTLQQALVAAASQSKWPSGSGGQLLFNFLNFAPSKSYHMFIHH
jgi:hypothetical protein